MSNSQITTMRSLLRPALACLLTVSVIGCKGEDEPVRGEGSIHVPKPGKDPVPEHLRKQYNLPDTPVSKTE